MSAASEESTLPPDWRWSCDRVLVATDGSAPSVAAVGWAARIAEDVPAQLLTVYAFDIDDETGTPTGAQAAAQTRVERWCADNGASGYDMRCVAMAGDPRLVLRDAIGHEHPDLIVVGARGGGGFPGLVVGSVTEWLGQTASFPLAVVPDVARVRTGGPILVGVDGSVHSTRALHWAIGLAGRLRRSVHAVHGSRWDAPSGDDPNVKAVTSQIDAARPHANALHVELDISTCSEHPVAALAARARDEDAEAVVVGARGHGDFGELTVGRVPRQLLHVASRPVIIVAT